MFSLANFDVANARFLSGKLFKAEVEDAVFKLGVDVVWIDIVGQIVGSLEAGEEGVFTLTFCDDGQHPIFKRDGDFFTSKASEI